jgi:hypothetical protein
MKRMKETERETVRLTLKNEGWGTRRVKKKKELLSRTVSG